MQSGLIKKWMKHHWPMEGNKCDKSRSKLSLTRTSLSDAFGGFFVLGVGIMTSIFFFILEIIVHKSRDLLLAISKRKNEGGNRSTLEKNTEEKNPFKQFPSIYSRDNHFDNNIG